MHDDLQVIRIYEMERCLSDGQIPCRWAPDMGAGYGQPMFNFYGPFPYYLGTLIRIMFPISIIGTVKLLFIISLLVSAFGMYILVREFWGRKAGILSAVLYAYAPYHALDIFVRGALSELFALAIIPLLLYGIYKVVLERKLESILVTSTSIFILFTSHNISSLIYSPFIVIWVLFWVFRIKNWKSFADLTFAGILGLGLSSFFLLPNLLEQSLIQKESLVEGYYIYSSHFVSLSQLFTERDWGYGPSTFGPMDEMSFQIGWPHWWIGILIVVLAAFNFKNKKKKYVLISTLLLSLAGISAFMTHLRSHLIWENISLLRFVQFPWRFLGLTTFFLSFAGGVLLRLFNSRKNYIFWGIVLLTIVLNFNFSKPEHYWSWATDQEKLSGIQFEIQQKAAILDYLPITANEAPKELAFDQPNLVEGEGTAYNFSERSNRFFFDADVQEDATFQIPIMFYPGWVALENGTILGSYPSGEFGLITLELTKGRHIIQGRFIETPIRRFSNLITLLMFLLIIFSVAYKKNRGSFLGFT